MKVYYFNDRTVEAVVFTNDFNGKGITLSPGTGELFDLGDVPPTSIPFVKNWEHGHVLISYIDKSLFAND
jgi:hypothetical protein